MILSEARLRCGDAAAASAAAQAAPGHEQEAAVLGEMRSLGATVLAIVESGNGLPADYLVELRSGLDELTGRILHVPNLVILLGLKMRTGGYGGAYLGLSAVLLLLVAIIALLSGSRSR